MPKYEWGLITFTPIEEVPLDEVAAKAAICLSALLNHDLDKLSASHRVDLSISCGLLRERLNPPTK